MDFYFSSCESNAGLYRALKLDNLYNITAVLDYRTVIVLLSMLIFQIDQPNKMVRMTDLYESWAGVNVWGSDSRNHVQ